MGRTLDEFQAQAMRPLATKLFEPPVKWPAILECPCCGGKPEFKYLHACWIECTCCGLSTPAYDDADIAARAWNGQIQAVEVEKYLDVKSAIPAPIDSDRSQNSKDTVYTGMLTEDQYKDAQLLKVYREAGLKPPSRSAYERMHPKTGRPLAMTATSMPRKKNTT